MWLIQKSSKEYDAVYYPYGGTTGWTYSVREACHYARREEAEQVIKNLAGMGIDVTEARVVEDPLPESERFAIVAQHNRPENRLY